MLLLDPNINSLVTSFCPRNNYLVFSTICKEWKYHDKHTSLRNVASSLSMIEEFHSYGGIITEILILYSIIEGKLENLIKLVELSSNRSHIIYNKSVFEQEFIHGNMLFTTKFSKHVNPDCVCNPEFSYIAAKHGRLDILKWIQLNYFKSGFTFNRLTLEYACISGNTDLMKWLISHDCKFDYKTFRFAYQYGTIGSMKFLLENGCEGNIEYFLEKFPYYGDFDIIKLMDTHKRPFAYQTCRYIYDYHSLDDLKWYIKNIGEWGQSPERAECHIEWLRENDCPWACIWEGPYKKIKFSTDSTDKPSI